MNDTASPQITLFTSTASQWAYVAHLTLDEKGYDPSEYSVKQIGLVEGENFAPEYVKINPNGTIPSMTSASLPEPLVDSADILKYLDSNRSKGSSLFPGDPKQRSKVEELIAHVHQPQLSTNLILLQARDVQEMNAKKAGIWKVFVGNRQEKLTKYGAAHPEIPLYASRTPENGQLYRLYNTEIGPEHQQFFDDSHQGYKDFAAGLNKLDSMLVLPYAVGEKVTAADMHIVPWFAHALWGAGGEKIQDLHPLEDLIKKSVPDFKIGERIKAWWKNISATESFKKNYPNLH
ncbi:uncharacterized protein N7515_000466 [Penicillium bovifimosum]|uniref:Maleylacetoacetate isomerase n=1 Tax=Penicillium bovifimosum TaxID=126998 RepID=A0A9W9LB42_9EURO|nr:uncharacterized protein N7515_000466 [Penicillium bovifimosum]KAJ5145902.1 hypothetical protein N7515_000466 [Penicillium bovifimosum]